MEGVYPASGGAMATVVEMENREKGKATARC